MLTKGESMKKTCFVLGIVGAILLGLSAVGLFLFGSEILGWAYNPDLIAYIQSKLPDTVTVTNGELTALITLIGWVVLIAGILSIPGVVIDIIIAVINRNGAKPVTMPLGITLGVLEILFGTKIVGIFQIITATCFPEK